MVRIRLGVGPQIQNKRGKNRPLALAVAALLMPAALVAYVLGLWRLGSDLKITGAFAISTGFFSHWQVWLPLAVVLQLSAVALNRYGRSGELRFPGIHFRR